MVQSWNDLDIPERLNIFFDSCGCLGISEFINCLSQKEYGSTIEELKVTGISVQFGNVSFEGNFIYQRDENGSLQQFVWLASFFQNFSIPEQQALDAIFLELADALNGKGERILFQALEVLFS